MQTPKEKIIKLKEKKLDIIKALMKLPAKYITEYNNYEIDGILYDIESDLKPYYNKDTRCFGLRLKNNIMLYIFEFNFQKYVLTDLDGETIVSTRDDTTEESIALKELYEYCKKETNNHYNKSMEKFNKILESI